MLTLEERFAGVIIGTAVGDALGLPMEGIKPRRIQKLYAGPLKHRFLFGNGMISDDTEHTVFVCQSLLEQPNDPLAFQKALARNLRYWLLGAPAGIGFATLKSILRLWCGIPPSCAGVFSAGNGPAMRSAIIGSYFHNEPELRTKFVQASTQLTHTDPKALVASMAIAESAAWVTQGQQNYRALYSILKNISADPEWLQCMAKLEKGMENKIPVTAFAHELNLHKGITGYCYQTVPMALFAWLRHFDHFETALEDIIKCGGDTDTTAAITGALAGCTLSMKEIPRKWIDGLREYPMSVTFLSQLAKNLANQKSTNFPCGRVPYFWPAIVPRNILFTSTVLFHGARRLLPPY